MNSLVATLEPADTAGVLTAALSQVHGPAARLQAWSVHRISNRGKHRTVRYELDVCVDGAAEICHHQWVGKFYEQNEDARRTAAILQELAAGDCGARGGMVIPRVMAYYAPLRLLLLAYEVGQSVTSALGPHNPPVLAAIGRALAALHATPAGLDGPVISAADVLAELQPRLADLYACFPGEVNSLRQAQAQLERQMPREAAPPSLLHGDFGPAQLLWQSGHLVVLDFDQTRQGDPACDLGNLLAQFRRITLRKPAKLGDFAALRQGILAAYQRHAPPDPDLSERVAWHERATLLRKIHFLVSNTTRHSEADSLQSRRAEALLLLGDVAAWNKLNAPTGTRPCVAQA
jgi:aminoglycoside phosphotransferase (APT) family kinase protein